MDNEINAVMKNKTFVVIDKPTGRNIVGSKWVFKTKKNADCSLERFRARDIALGFSQAPGCNCSKIHLALSSGMNPYDYLSQYALETNGDYDNWMSNPLSLMEN